MPEKPEKHPLLDLEPSQRYADAPWWCPQCAFPLDLCECRAQASDEVSNAL